MIGATINSAAPPMEHRVGKDPKDQRIADLEQEVLVTQLRLAELVQRNHQVAGERDRAVDLTRELQGKLEQSDSLAGRIRELESEAIQLRLEAGRARTRDAAQERDAEELDELRRWKAQLADAERNRETALGLERQQHAAEIKRLIEERDAAIHDRDEARKGAKRR